MPDDTVSYVDEIRRLASTLRGAGIAVADELIAVATLQGLPEEYNTFVGIVVHRAVTGM